MTVHLELPIVSPCFLPVFSHCNDAFLPCDLALITVIWGPDPLWM